MTLHRTTPDTELCKFSPTGLVFVLTPTMCSSYTSALCHCIVTLCRQVPDEMALETGLCKSAGQQRSCIEYVNWPDGRGYLVFVR